jgi:hypothetical protein
MRLATIAALVAAITAFVGTAAKAAPPQRFTLELTDVTFPDAYLSDACGTEVLDTVNGTLTAMLFSAGGTVREVDTLHGTITYAAPATGNSITLTEASSSHAVYPEGIAVGSPAVVRISGQNGGSITGVAPPGSGTIVANATIVAVDPSGIPLTAFGPQDIVSLNGNFAQATAEICAALT